MPGSRKSNKKSPNSPREWHFSQDYVLVRRDVFLERPDLVRTGRALWGTVALPRHQITASSFHELATLCGEEARQAQQQGLEMLCHQQPFMNQPPQRIRMIPEACDDAVMASAQRRHAALFDAFGIECARGAFTAPAPDSTWPWKIVQATLAESLALGPDAPTPVARAQRGDFAELLTNKSVQALQLPEDELGSQVRGLYAAYAAAGLREAEVLLTLFPAHTRELAHAYGQAQSLGDEAKLEVLRTLIAPQMAELAKRLTAIEDKLPFPKTERLRP